ncbi:hypothetical protein D9623_09590 [Azospirillum brasilense]|uniref:Uncharacterized protein n=2 Tax=Azospirillum brasilense TaxID=192 RepID=A0A0P0EZ19_AZOBR|nr:hypothetical protein AMK58_08845 [Azospirillum brasilense]PWC95035.1 hypothetical protein AEJ54_07865 [Azospirillum sp. Sp 7]NUB25975.1 hypothetical protein [Azospirillum brasilense]NUB34203.1 hypothetical protein [Azospirillum brasilense]OPH16705.1 hypothetical protein FE89_04150 [Azospirillum brasilense]
MVMVYHPYALQHRQERRSGRRLALALIVALGFPLAAGAGYTLETVRGYAVQARLAQAVDAAALAGGRVMFDDQRDGHIRSFFDNAFTKSFLGAHAAVLKIEDDTRSGVLTVHGQATVKALFTRVLGGSDLVVEAQSVVRRNVRGRKGA